jgi:hypothetical protein
VKRYSTALLVLAACGALATQAVAAPPAQVELTSNSSCPSAADVIEELTPLLPHTRVEAGSTETTTADGASIEDEGERVRVRVAGQERVFRDPARSCRERARTAAVFIGLVLDPPILPEVPRPAPPAPPPPPPRAEPKPSPPSSLSTPLKLELGPLLEAAPISDARQVPLAGGFGGRLAWGRAVGVSAGAAFLLPTRLALPAADARLVWLPFDLALRATQAAGAVALAAELGPEFALLFVSGERVKNPRTSTRLELGARAAVSLTWSMSPRLGAFITLFSVWRPKPYEFRVNPELTSGTTPPLWVGASLGLSFRAR